MAMHDPPHPGEFILEAYLEPLEISVRSLADSLGVAASTLNRVINGQNGISPEMALRLSKAIGRSGEHGSPCSTITTCGAQRKSLTFPTLNKPTLMPHNQRKRPTLNAPVTSLAGASSVRAARRGFFGR